MMDMAFSLLSVQGRIEKAMQEAERSDTPCLVAVSKLQPPESIARVAFLGQSDFGENYLQEALEKQKELQNYPCLPPITWHFTGHVQSRKAKDVVGRFDLIHSVDTEKLALALQKHAEEKNLCQKVLIQVNVGEESQKSGVNQEGLLSLAKCISSSPNLELQGLMCLPPVFDAGLAARPHFALLRNLRNTLQEELGYALPHLSMGMSGDLEAAILEGATIVRVGTDIFGARTAYN